MSSHLTNPYRFPFRTNAVVFDGTSDILSADGLSGIGSSGLGTISCWVRIQEADGATANILTRYTGVTQYLEFQRLATNCIRVYGRSGIGNNILGLRSAAGSVVQNIWYHFLASWDLSDAGKRHVYLNDVTDLNVDYYAGSQVSMDGNDWFVGSPNGSQADAIEMADLYFNIGVYVDFSIESNRRKFIDASGNPVWLGRQGELPTGAQPHFFFTDDAGTWHTNKGSAGGFTLAGVLTTAATSPSD